MNKLEDLLDEAREVLNGEVNCDTPEFKVLDLILKALDNIYDEIR